MILLNLFPGNSKYFTIGRWVYWGGNAFSSRRWWSSLKCARKPLVSMGRDYVQLMIQMEHWQVLLFLKSLEKLPWYQVLLPIPHVRKIVKSFTNVWKAFVKLGPNLVKAFHRCSFIFRVLIYEIGSFQLFFLMIWNVCKTSQFNCFACSMLEYVRNVKLKSKYLHISEAFT